MGLMTKLDILWTEHYYILLVKNSNFVVILLRCVCADAQPSDSAMVIQRIWEIGMFTCLIRQFVLVHGMIVVTCG